jgi:hypothetical protein
MPELIRMLHDRFDREGIRPPKSGMANPKKDPDFVGQTPPPLIKEKKPRTIGSVYVALQSQKVYDPNTPTPPQPAPANLQERGTVASVDASGPWGKPEGDK